MNFNDDIINEELNEDDVKANYCGVPVNLNRKYVGGGCITSMNAEGYMYEEQELRGGAGGI